MVLLILVVDQEHANRTSVRSTRIVITGELYDLEPIFTTYLHCIHQTFEGDRLADVRLVAEFINTPNVLPGFGSSQNYNGDGTKLRIGLNLTQCLPPVLSGPVSGQARSSWTRRFRRWGEPRHDP